MGLLCPVVIPFSHTHCLYPPAAFALTLYVITVKSLRCFIGFPEASEFFQPLVFCDPAACLPLHLVHFWDLHCIIGLNSTYPQSPVCLETRILK